QTPPCFGVKLVGLQSIRCEMVWPTRLLGGKLGQGVYEEHSGALRECLYLTWRTLRCIGR
ncbi:uncharacterized protein METZ01_LOCUS170603, partial [marine metagenome]